MNPLPPNWLLRLTSSSIAYLLPLMSYLSPLTSHLFPLSYYRYAFPRFLAWLLPKVPENAGASISPRAQVHLGTMLASFVGSSGLYIYRPLATGQPLATDHCADH